MRPRKGDECELPHAARAASGDDNSDAVPPRMRPHPPLHVTRHLLQLVSLIVLVSFGLVGSLLFTTRPSSVSHVALRHGISQLHERIAIGGNGRLSSTHPLYFSVMILDLQQHSDAVYETAQRFAPDLLIIRNAQALLDMEKALPNHLPVADKPVYYNTRILQSAEMEGTDNMTPLHLRFHSRNDSLIVMLNGIGSAVDYQNSPVLVISDTSTASSSQLTDPFDYLRIVKPSDPVLTASSRLRPVAASMVQHSESSLSPSVSIVYELLSQ